MSFYPLPHRPEPIRKHVGWIIALALFLGVLVLILSQTLRTRRNGSAAAGGPRSGVAQQPIQVTVLFRAGSHPIDGDLLANVPEAEGMELVGPLPADTAFTRPQLETADAVLAMYHDQGLPVLKHASFGAAVNVTLGLPIVRTSVDHGTALDLAGSGRADCGSLVAMIMPIIKSISCAE